MKKIFLTFLSVAYFFAVFAQKTNWESSLRFGASYYKGNVNRSDLLGEGKVKHVDSIFEYAMEFKEVYSESENKQNNQEMLGSIKVDIYPTAKFSPFAVLSAFSNTKKGFDLRTTELLGMKYVFFKYPSDAKSVKELKGVYSVSVAFQHDYEKYTGVDSSTQKYRVSFRPKIRQKIFPNTFLEHFTFFRFDISDEKNYGIESNTSITVKISKMLDLKISYEYDYVNKPPLITLKKEDQAFISSIVFNF